MVTDVASRQYPHYLYKRTSNGEAVQDATQIQAANGKFVTFASLIQIPKGVQRIPEGMEIAVADEPLEPSRLLNQETMEEAKISGIIRISGVCLKFDKGRLHCRLWV